MYGVSKITSEPDIMLTTFPGAQYSAQSLAEHLEVFAKAGIVVDMICQSAPRGAEVDFSFTTSYANLPAVMAALPEAAKAHPPLISGGYSKVNLFGEEMVTSCGVAARALRALAGAGVEGVALLCTGASLDRDMELVVAETVHTCWLFARKRPENPALCAALDGQDARFALFTPEGEPVELPLDETGGPKWAKLPRKPLVVWAGGGIMDPLLKTLARRGAPTTLVAADATHVLAGRSALEQFLRCGGEMRVRRELTIAAVAANPWSAYGWHFEPDKFIAALREVIDLPVVNVKED